MRLGNRSPNEFIQLLNEKNKTIEKLFLEKIVELTQMTTVKVMMGDATVTDQKSFDPKKVSDYFKMIDDNLKDWSIQAVSISNNEDLRRIFTKFEIMEGNYLISVHLSVQFHVLLYYKPVQRVIECQKELAEIVETTKTKEQEISNKGDQVVLDKLKDMGYRDFDHQKLFEVFYENDELREKVYSEIEKTTDANFQKLSDKKQELFRELDSLLMETYQTSPVLIDDTRLVAGEEGCLITIDLEFIKNKNKEGLFDPRKMSTASKENIVKKIDLFANLLKL